MDEDEYFDDKVDKGCFNIYYAADFPADSNSLRSVCWFFTIPAKLVTTPFVYTMSKPAWDVMLRRTYTMIRKPSEYTDYRNWAGRDLEKWQKNYPAGTGALAEFYGLYLDPENEDRELNIGGLIPSGSLLTWIDNNFTTPATEIDRRAGRWSNMYQTL